MLSEFYEPFSRLWTSEEDNEPEQEVEPPIPSYEKVDWDELDSDEALLTKSFRGLEEVLAIVRSYIASEKFEHTNDKGPILPKVCSVVNRLHTCLSAMVLRARDEAGNEPVEMLYLYRLVSEIVNHPKFAEKYDVIYPVENDTERFSAEDLDAQDGETPTPSTGTTASLTPDDYPYRLIGFLSRSEAEHFVSDPNCPVVSKAYLAQVRFTLEDYGYPTSTIKRVLSVLAPAGPLNDVSH